MSETKINASQTTITAEDIGASSAFDTMPTAAIGYLNKIVQYVGTTDATYTNGYFYKCVSDGQTPATYSWTQTDVQPNAGGLPTQTGQSGKFLTTDGTDASWSDTPFVQKDPNGRGVCISSYSQLSFVTQENSKNIAIVGSYSSSTMSLGKNSVVIAGQTDSAPGNWGVSIGSYGRATGKGSIALGAGAQATANGAIQISSASQGNYGYSQQTNSDADTFKVANYNGNFEMMSANGTIPADRFTTTPVADGSYVPTLTISSGVVTRSWTTPAGGATSATATLAVADWGSNTQTVNVTGVTANNNVIVAAAPASQADYTSAGIICTAQGAGTLTFTCTTVPSNAITVNVLILN